MRRRRTVTLAMLIGGVVLMVVSYFFLAAPWGLSPSSVDHSNPRVPFAPTIFILGVILVFLAAVVYEILPEEPEMESKKQ
ncbi:MAG: hypothetical protein ACE5I2_00710 [Anaerolineae bacterium]